ncbi:hypothetical protein [Haladaptatus sp.]|uniref:hypothetical protein n=1 Tax=Haladaptatus sp. TaxID=1973141 RepID=UPI003C53D2AC
MSPIFIGAVVTLIVAVPILGYYPNVRFGQAFLFSIVTVAFYLLLNAVLGGDYGSGAGLHGSPYPVIDVVLLWTAATAFAYVLVVRTDW